MILRDRLLLYDFETRLMLYDFERYSTNYVMFLFPFQNSVRCGVFPATLSSLALTITGYNAMYLTRDLHKSDIDPSFGLIDLLRRHINL